jgi:hypothetical protein
MKRIISGIVVMAFGALTSLFTVVLLVLTELIFSFALHTFMFCFVVPIGAIGAGFLASSGYYVGAKLLNRRPTKFLLVGMVMVALATFFLVHYLEFVTLRIAVPDTYDQTSFGNYLDIVFRNASLRFMGRPGNTGGLGAWGYVFAFLQVAGFMLGGLVAYVALTSQPYCQRCSRYFSSKGQQRRFTSDIRSLSSIAGALVNLSPGSDLQPIVDAHAKHGTVRGSKEDNLRSNIEIRFCKKCGQHWLKFSVQKKVRDDWKEINQLTLERYCDRELSARIFR